MVIGQQYKEDVVFTLDHHKVTYRDIIRPGTIDVFMQMDMHGRLLQYSTIHCLSALSYPLIMIIIS